MIAKSTIEKVFESSRVEEVIGDKNVIKIKPPLVFNKDNTDTLIYFLRKVLKEDPMQVKL